MTAVSTLAFNVLWQDKGATSGMEKLGTTTEKTHKKFTALKITAAAALAAVGVAAVKFGKDSVQAYADAEEAQKSLGFAFSKFPALADTNQKALQRLNSELAKKTKYDDDNIASGQAVLAQFKLTGKQVTDVTPLLLDYASKTGKDVPAAAQDLGKALLGNAKALKNIGISYKSTGDPAKDFANITQLMRDKVGGFADKEGKTASGRLAIMKNQFGELQEAAGSQLLPALSKIADGLLKIVGFVNDNAAMLGSFKRIAAGTFGAFAESVGLGKLSFQGFADWVETHQGAITKGFITAAKGALWLGKALAIGASIGLKAIALLMDAVNGQVGLILAGYSKITHGAVLAFGWIPGIGDKLKTADAAFAAMAEDATTGMSKAAAGARAMADGIDKNVIPAIDDAGDALDDLAAKEIFNAEQRDRIAKTKQAIDGIGTAADGSQIKIKKWADRTKLGANEQAALKTRLTNTKAALGDQLTAMRYAGAGQDKLSKAWETGKKRLYEEFRQMGLSKDEAGRLARKYAGIPPKARTKIETPGMKTAKGEIDTLKTKVNDLDGDTITVHVKVKVTDKGDIYINGSKRGSAGGIGSAVGASYGSFLAGKKPVPGGANRHSGYPWAVWAGDFPVGMGTPIHAWGPGKVTATNFWNHSYGRHTRISHPNGWHTLYAHQSKIAVHPGQSVKAGQVIGLTGSTGNSSGPHLHFEKYGRGGYVGGPSVIVAGDRGPERVLNDRQTRAFESWMGRGAGSGGGTTIVINAPHWVGDTNDLRRTLIDMNSRGELDRLKR